MSAAALSSHTAVMQQYLRLKAEFPETLRAARTEQGGSAPGGAGEVFVSQERAAEFKA